MPCCANVGLTVATDRPGVLVQIIMIRALYSYVRVLPAYRLHRVAKVSAHQQLWRKIFNVSTGSCPDIVPGIMHNELPVIMAAVTHTPGSSLSVWQGQLLKAQALCLHSAEWHSAHALGPGSMPDAPCWRCRGCKASLYPLASS